MLYILWLQMLCCCGDKLIDDYSLTLQKGWVMKPSIQRARCELFKAVVSMSCNVFGPAVGTGQIKTCKCTVFDCSKLVSCCPNHLML